MKKSYLMAVVVALAACNTTPNPDSSTPDFIAGTNYLSDVLGGTGFSKDSTNGKTLSIAGVAYRKGVAVQNDSALGLNTGQQCTSFSAYVGLDSNTAKTGDKIKFELLADGKSVFATQNLTNKNGAVFTGPIDISKAAHLEFKTVGTGVANWANAKLNCKSVGVQIAATDITAPELDSVSPWGQAVAVSSYVALDFLEPMQPNTVSITMNPPVQFKQQVFWNSDDSYARFVPVTLLQPNTDYTVSVAGQDLAGNDLTGFYKTWSFKTGALSGTGDDVSPELDSVAPWGQNVATTTSISLDFTETVNVDSVKIYTEPPIEFQKPVFWNSGNNYVAFTPTKPLLPGTNYKIGVFAKDLAGNNLLGGFFQWSFKTSGNAPAHWGFTGSFGDRSLQSFFVDSQKNIYTLANKYLPSNEIDSVVSKWSGTGQLIWEKSFVNAVKMRLLADNSLMLVTAGAIFSDGSGGFAYQRYFLNTVDGFYAAPALLPFTKSFDFLDIRPNGAIDVIEHNCCAPQEWFWLQLDSNLTEQKTISLQDKGIYDFDDFGNAYRFDYIGSSQVFEKYTNLFSRSWSTPLDFGQLISWNFAPSSGDWFVVIAGSGETQELVRLDDSGKIRWRLSNLDPQLQTGIIDKPFFSSTGCTNSVQESYVSGWSSSGFVSFLSKVNSSGQVLWSRTDDLPASSVTNLYCLPDGGVRLAYSTNGYVNDAFGLTIKFVEYDKDGYQR